MSGIALKIRAAAAEALGYGAALSPACVMLLYFHIFQSKYLSVLNRYTSNFQSNHYRSKSSIIQRNARIHDTAHIKLTMERIEPTDHGYKHMPTETCATVRHALYRGARESREGREGRQNYGSAVT